MEHPIVDLLEVSLENIKQMIDVDTIIGKPIIGNEDTIIIPVSKVVVGFASGGSEFSPKSTKMPFGGGTGGSLSISPQAFLVVKGTDVRLLHLGEKGNVMESVIDKIPELAYEAVKMISARENG